MDRPQCEQCLEPLDEAGWCDWCETEAGPGVECDACGEPTASARSVVTVGRWVDFGMTWDALYDSPEEKHTAAHASLCKKCGYEAVRRWEEMLAAWIGPAIKNAGGES